MVRMILPIGSNKTNLMIGDNVTDPREQNERRWMIETDKVIAKNLIHSIVQLLGAKVRYVTVIDKKSSHKRIVIDYDFSSNLQ